MPVIHPQDARRDGNEDETLGRYDALLLGDTGGLTQFGALLETLYPGSQSSKKHWHENEDEFVYLVAGEVVLIEDDAETPMRAGDAATFKAGDRVGHCLQNRSQEPATYIVVGTRSDHDVFHYPDEGLTVERKGRKRIVRRDDGTIVREYER